MKKIVIAIVMILVLHFWVAGAEADCPVSLKEIYKTGEMTLIETQRINNDTLPENAQIKFPEELLQTEKNDIFVLDGASHHLLKFSSEGKFLKAIGREGQGPGDLYVPTSMAQTDTHIVVYELGNRRFSFFDFDGAFVKVVKPEGIKRKPFIFHFFYLPPGGYAVEYLVNHRRGEKPQEVFIELFTKDFDFKKKLFSQRFCRIKQVGKSNFLQPFHKKIVWNVLPTGKIVMGVVDTGLLKIYDPVSAAEKTIPHRYDPIKVTEEMKETYFRGITWGGKRLEKFPEMLKKYYDFPKYKPPFHSIAVDLEGNILVFPEERSSYFYAYDQAGVFLNKVTLTSGSINPRQVYFLKDGSFWYFDFDLQAYEHSIVRCKIEKSLKPGDRNEK